MSGDSPREFYVSLWYQKDKLSGHHISLTAPGLGEKPQEARGAPDPPPHPSAASPSDFHSVCEGLTSAMDSYLRFIPLTLSLATDLGRGLAELQIADFVRKLGRKRSDLSDAETQVYALDLHHWRDISIRADEVVSSITASRQLPGVMTIGLVSTYDAFLSELIKVILNRRPEIVLTSEKNIKFSEIARFSSIEEVRGALIDREVETVLRSSHVDQFAWMEERFSIKLRSDLAVWPAFVELCERRNLLTHTGGTVSSQYVENCKRHGVELAESISPGQVLNVDQAYFSKAVEVIYEIGVKLCHVLWRKFAKEEMDRADAALNELCFDLIFTRYYALAERLLIFATVTLKMHSNDRLRRVMIINLANAIRLQGRKAEALRFLEAEDWSASGADFRICAAAVRGDVDEVIRLMKATKDVSEDDYQSWPVFRGIRTDDKFMAAFEEFFGKPIFSPRNIELSGDPPIEKQEGAS